MIPTNNHLITMKKELMVSVNDFTLTIIPQFESFATQLRVFWTWK